MRNIIIGSAISGSVFYLYKLAIISKSLTTVFKNIRVFRFSASQIELEIDLSIRNTSSKTLEIDNIFGDLFIDGIKAGMLTLKTPLLIKLGDNPIKLGVTISNKSALSSLTKMVLTRRTPSLLLKYRIKLPFFSIPQKVEIPSGSVANLKVI